MKNIIVITSIFEPTEAVRAFSKMKNIGVVVVGDKKSPSGWECGDVDFLSVEQQLALPFRLAKLLPYNHYCRKMLGYLKAIRLGAGCIIDTDDDNIPKENWGFPEPDNEYDCIDSNRGFVNIYQYYTATTTLTPPPSAIQNMAPRITLTCYQRGF